MIRDIKSIVTQPSKNHLPVF